MSIVVLGDSGQGTTAEDGGVIGFDRQLEILPCLDQKPAAAFIIPGIFDQDPLPIHLLPFHDQVHLPLVVGPPCGNKLQRTHFLAKNSHVVCLRAGKSMRYDFRTSGKGNAPVQTGAEAFYSRSLHKSKTDLVSMRTLELEGDNPIECPGVIYLDMNIVIALRKNEDPQLSTTVCRLYEKGYIFPYSPAHIEEVAMVARTTDEEHEADERVNDNLDFLARLTKHIEIIRGAEDNDPTHFRRECPSVCMQRVLDRYELTHLSEAAAKLVRSTLGDGTPAICPLDILDSDLLQPHIIAKLRNQRLSLPEIPKGSLLGSNHSTLQRTVDSLFNALAAAGFAREKAKMTRSAIHDVTHGIHGVLSDQFITNDDRFRAKLKAVYHYLKCKTEVLSKEEFLIRHSC